jgi:dihydroorotase
MAFELILRGGRVLDPGRGTDATLDVAFADGRVAAMAPRLEDRGAEEVDVAGRLVTPGLIDLHGHFFYRGQPMFTDPDAVCLPNGVRASARSRSSPSAPAAAGAPADPALRPTGV